MRRALVTVALVALLSSCGSAGDPPTGADGGTSTSASSPEQSDASAEVSVDGSSSCASALEYDGRRYTGHGDLMYTPETTGRTGTGRFPACGDMPAEQILVEELGDIGPGRAVLANGTIFLAEDEPFPEEIRFWFAPPPCDSNGSFEVTGDWIGVTTTVEPRYDGDLVAPYRVELWVTATGAGGEDYDGRMFHVRVTAKTDPRLGRQDVKTSLWEGGTLTALVHCEGEAFVAERIRSDPPT